MPHVRSVVRTWHEPLTDPFQARTGRWMAHDPATMGTFVISLRSGWPRLFEQTHPHWRTRRMRSSLRWGC